MKGRKPIPLELHHLNGNPGRRPLPEPIPVPEGRPECPSHFSEDSKAEWERACDLIEHMGVLSKADACAVEMFVDTFVRWRAACINVSKYGEVQCLDVTKRILVVNPYFRVRNQLWTQLYQLMGEFGFTPVARSRLKNGADKKENTDDPLVAMMMARAGRN